MVIREIETRDADAFWQMQFQLDKETKFMMYEPNERTKNLELIKNIIQKAIDGSNLLLVAENDTEIVGFISVQRGLPNRIKHTAYIVVGIRKAFQGKGIGSEFFKRLDLWARQNSITRLELTVMSPNIIAKHLYEKYGFVVEGIKKNSMFVDGEYVDEFYMAKLL
ncbi:GNAT family N-acetyltransferase [Clostridium cellulovorans]|uniref:GCN5-related N-acetyltransferase n=1 Tax=Clostridium cellulovorans (strain ATCC 35296 / DSM 3052 / OCM 3 / 743B) TaxID=573061 RepID=D9SRT5_CLOC7|nr:GNAT family protein [Clostridium cellulovorans]ADL50452.1 GCN5-related N-acetyltransferase [Clostridium cellulovorans 743B]